MCLWPSQRWAVPARHRRRFYGQLGFANGGVFADRKTRCGFRRPLTRSRNTMAEVRRVQEIDSAKITTVIRGELSGKASHAAPRQRKTSAAKKN